MSAATCGTTKSLLDRGRSLAERTLTHDLLLVSGVLALLVVIFFYDVVFLGHTLLTSSMQQGVMGLAPPFGYPGDPPGSNPYLVDPLASAAGAEPALERMSRLIRDLEFPLWNPNVALGRPFVAEATNASFSPIRLPVMLWPSPQVWDAFLLARMFVAGLFTYLLAKRLGLAKPAAFGTAVAFTFSGFFMLKINMEHTDFAMMIPVLLFAFELLVERPGPGRMAFAAVAVALGVLAVNPQPALVLLLYGSGYYLARAFVRLRSEDGFRIVPRLLPLGAALGLGLGLSAFMVLPLLELSGSLGFSGLGVHGHADRGIGFDRLPALITLFVPYLDGAPLNNFQGTGFTGIRNYAGVVTAFLAVIGLWNRSAMGKMGWFFLGAAVLLLAKTYGVPLVNSAGRLPLLGVVDFPQYLPPVTAFSIAMLAGLGLDQLAKARWRLLQPLLAAVALGALLGWLVWLNRDILDSIPGEHLRIQLGFAGGLIVAATALTLAIHRGLLPASAGTALIAGLIAVELFAFTTPTKGQLASEFHPDLPMVERPQRYDSFTQPPFVDFLKEDTSKYRVVGLNLILYPNASEAYDIDDIRGLTAVTVERYLEYVKNFVDPDANWRFRGENWPHLDTPQGRSLLGGNPMLNLLNVKYVITRRGLPLAYDSELAAQFIPAESQPASRVRLDVFSINGEDDAVLFQHPPSSLSYTVTPDEESRFLLFRLALDPVAWDPSRGDGVRFKVSLEDGGAIETVYTRWVNPKDDPEDRRWIEGMVDLEPYQGRPVTLILSTSPGASSFWDWAGWGGLRLAASPDEPTAQSAQSQFELVYDDEVKIYRNNDAFPRAFIVHRAEMAPNRDAALALMGRPSFDPSSTAVVEGEMPPDVASALSANPHADGSSVEITRYSDSRVQLLAKMESPGLLVLSDTYYPGWKATVDGRRAEIHPTDLALRSVFLPAGEHRVEFVFSPGSFKWGATLGVLSLLALTLYAAWGPSSRALRGWMKGRAGRL